MKAQPSVATMKLIAGDPTLDFVNTVDCRLGDWGPDLLVDYDALVAWAIRVGLIAADVAPGLLDFAAADSSAAGEALERAKALREALYRLFLRECEASSGGAEDIVVLNAWVLQAMACRRLVVDDGGAVVWRWRDDVGLDTVTCRVALCAADLLLKRDRRPVRACPGPRCGWLFLDTTKGGRRLWCASEACGTRVRVARFRASA